MRTLMATCIFLTLGLATAFADNAQKEIKCSFYSRSFKGVDGENFSKSITFLLKESRWTGDMVKYTADLNIGSEGPDTQFKITIRDKSTGLVVLKSQYQGMTHMKNLPGALGFTGSQYVGAAYFDSEIPEDKPAPENIDGNELQFSCSVVE